MAGQRSKMCMNCQSPLAHVGETERPSAAFIWPSQGADQ